MNAIRVCVVPRKDGAWTAVLAAGSSVRRVDAPEPFNGGPVTKEDAEEWARALAARSTLVVRS